MEQNRGSMCPATFKSHNSLSVSLVFPGDLTLHFILAAAANGQNCKLSPTVMKSKYVIYVVVITYDWKINEILVTTYFLLSSSNYRKVQNKLE
jgi:hypothetical protein